jgi:putative SOS response-associated peptidase YedK
MCGRFTQHFTWQEVAEFLNVFGTPRNLQPHYNLAPTDTVEVVRLNEAGQREMVPMRWDLIPAWWKKPLKEKPPTFNARIETVATAPMFRDAYKNRRCVVPVSGFYEWTGEKKARKPHLFTAANGAPLYALAGLWDRWRHPETGEEVLSCTLITTAANEWMTPYHNRMPALIAQEGVERWLRGEMVVEELHAVPNDVLREKRASTRVNKSGVFDEDPTVLESEELDLL